VLQFLSCGFKKATKNEILIHGKDSKEWIIDKIMKNGKESNWKRKEAKNDTISKKFKAITFSNDKSYSVDGVEVGTWNLSENEDTIITLSNQCSFSRPDHIFSKIVTLDSNNFVWESIDEHITTTIYLKKE